MKPRRNKGRNPNLVRPGAPNKSAASPALSPTGDPAATPGIDTDVVAPGPGPLYWGVACAVALGLGAFLFADTMRRLVNTWDIEPDYSHGFLVAPFAALMLWLRRDSMPATSQIPGWGGLLLLGASFGVRYLGERYFLTPLAAYALVLWIAGACWLLAGYRLFAWASPAIAFLLFMVPLPFRFEQGLSWHLQSIATRVSSTMLQCLGQPAISEGHTIFLGEHVLEIEQACSGLRMFMGIAAVAFAFIVLNPRPWWERVLLALAVAPVAIVANALRIVLTGLLMRMVSGEAAAKFSHDAAGWVMIVIAAILFSLLVAYLRRLFVAVEVDTGRDLLKGVTAT